MGGGGDQFVPHGAHLWREVSHGLEAAPDILAIPGAHEDVVGPELPKRFHPGIRRDLLRSRRRVSSQVEGALPSRVLLEVGPGVGDYVNHSHR